MHTVILLKNNSIIEGFKIKGSVTPPTVVCWRIRRDVLHEAGSDGRTVGHVQLITRLTIT